MPPSASDLALSVCHEVGNLLAAIRLQAELPGDDSVERIASLTARAGALAALVRPLLAPAPAESVEAAGVLAGLRRGLDEPMERRVDWDAAAAGGAWVRADGEALRHLALAELLARAGELAGDERVRVAVERAGEGAAFVVEGPGPPPAAGGASGPGLTRALAEHLLPGWGGRVEVRERAAGAGLALVLAAG